MEKVNINMPIVSSDFTIDDIHKIREYNYELTKHYNNEELISYYKKKADGIIKKYLLN